MKRGLFIINIAIVLAAAAWSANSPYIQNPSVNNPVSTGNVPQSSISTGLVRSPNPIDTTMNNVVTGNVAGGRYFRGVVPYNSVSDFGGRLGGLSPVESFMRYSADTGDLAPFTGRPTPYYSPISTVSILSPGTRGRVLMPSYMNLYSPTGSSSGLGPLPNQQYIPPTTSYLTNLQLRPLSTDAQGLEKILSQDAAKYPQGGIQAIQQYQAKLEKAGDELKEQPGKIPDIQQNVTDQLNPPQTNPEDKKQFGQNKQGDSFENIQKELEEVQKILIELKAGEIPVAVDDTKKQSDQESTQKKNTVSQNTAASDLSAKAKDVLGEHKTFESFEKAKYNEHIRDAENYMKQGKYYLAADSYSIALVYKPKDLAAYAGKCYALFAAGEYMSSALFLSRALELSPEYVNSKIDLVAAVGNKDLIESRAVDIQRWRQRSDSPELCFLLSYVYYRLDRPDFAKVMIDTAYEKMPDSPAVGTLKKAIYERLGAK